MIDLVIEVATPRVLFTQSIFREKFDSGNKVSGYFFSLTHEEIGFYNRITMTKESKTVSTIRRRKGKEVALALQKIKEENVSSQPPTVIASDSEIHAADVEDKCYMFDDRVLGPITLRRLMSQPRSLFLALLAIRCANALLIQTQYVPDEYWQSLEVAHKMVFGYGYLTWEWREGLRGYSYPLLFAVFYKIVRNFGLDSRFLLIKLPRLIQACIAAWGDIHLYRLSSRLAGRSAAQWTLLCQSFFFGVMGKSFNIDVDYIINIYIKGTRLKQKDQFKYLGSLISSDGRNNSEVASRIAQAKTNFQKMKTVLTNKNISIRTRRGALECYIEPVLMYGCEAWTISKQTQKKLEATEMWFLRRMLRISWTAKKTNDTVLEEAHTTRLLISKIRKRQATFFGHVMRREKLENLVTTGMLEGKRSRGK
ncbi:mannosyltransferase [Plakobranchus ocellatus]|uniref:Mannosyltransferase n=1 Tax=Plakobranchus ocellatus TaxID=259542 RepID=A0AAV3ZPZ2_9GAST|nr:mannosyltransferase [Plakobranchus ocellatus]